MNPIYKIKKSNLFLLLKNGNGFKYILFAALLSLVVTFFDIKTISLIPGLIDSITNKSSSNEAIYFIIFALISGVTRIILSYFSTKINIKISSNISNKVIDSASKINIYELEEFGISNLSQVFSNDIQTISNELVYPILQIITSSILTISIVTFITIEIPRITIIISSIYLILYYVFVKTSKKTIRKNSQVIAGLRAKFVQSASELVISARYLKGSIKGDRVSDFLNNNDFRIKKMFAKNNFLSIYPKFIAETIGLIAIATIGLYSALNGNSETLSIIATLALCIQKIIPSFQSIFVAISAINCNSANIDRMYNLIYISSKTNSYKKSLEVVNRIGNIVEISNVENLSDKNKNENENNNINKIVEISLTNSESNKQLFEFKLFKDTWTAITGKSGSGKTSFMDVITGIAFPECNNHYIKTEKGILNLKNDPHNKFIYLSQFNYIPNCPLIEYISNSDDSEFIRNNINFIFYLLKESGLAEELEIIKKGDLYKNISENASSISGGQAQRLNIIRTIFELKKISKNYYKILAMDEPFKGLDLLSKKKCINLLKEYSDTSILITHSREEAFSLCKRVYEIR